MSGIEGGGLGKSYDLGPDNAVDQVTPGQFGIPAAQEVTPVMGDRKPGHEQHRRGRRASPAPARATPGTSSGRTADVSLDVSIGDQVLVALDEALVRQTEGAQTPGLAAAIGDYTNRLTAPSQTKRAHTLSIEA